MLANLKASMGNTLVLIRFQFPCDQNPIVSYEHPIRRYTKYKANIMICNKT